jgi:hypothetical protein
VEKVFSTLPHGMKALLDQCVNRGLYGDQSTTIRHFINIGLERLVEQGRLVDSPLIQARSADAKNEEGGGQT